MEFCILAKFRLSFLLFILACVVNFWAPKLHSQVILKRVDKFVLVDNKSNIFVENHLYEVVKKQSSNGQEKVGAVKIIRIVGNKAAGEIVSEYADSVGIGDVLVVKKSASVKRKIAVGAYVGSAMALGAGLYLNSQANRAYSDYESAKTPESAQSLYNRTTDLDRQANIAFVVAAVLAAGGTLMVIFK